MADDVKVKFGATTAELEAGAKKASEAVKGAVDQMKEAFEKTKGSIASFHGNFTEMASGLKSDTSTIASSFSGLLAPLGSIKTAVLEVVGVLAGVTALFTSSVKDQDEWTRSSLSLARGLGITSQEASVLKVAMEQLAAQNLTGEVSTENLLRAYQMFIQKFSAGSEEVKKWGITWQGTGFDTFMKIIAKYQELSTSAEKAQMRFDFFGRQGMALGPILANLTTGAMEDARKKAEELGRVVGEDNVRASQQLSMASLHLHEAWQELHSHLATVGMTVWAGLKEIMALLLNTVNGVINGVNGIAKAMASAVNACSDFAKGLSNILQKLGRIITDSSSAEAGIHAMQKAMAPGMGEPAKIPSPTKDEPTDPPDKPNKPTGGGGEGGGSSIVQQWQAELDQLKMLNKAFQTQSLEMEKTFWASKLALGKVATREEETALKAAEKAAETARLKDEQKFWKDKLGTVAEGSKDYAEVEKKIVTLEQQINKSRLQGEIDTIKAKMQANQASLKDREALLDHEQALDHIDLEMKRENLSHLEKMGKLSKTKELKEYRDLLAAKHQADLLREKQRLLLYQGDEVKYKEHLKKMKLLHQNQQLALSKLDNQIAQQQRGLWESVWGSVTGSFKSLLSSLMEGTTDMGTALLSFLKNVGSAIMNIFIEMGLAAVKSFIVKQVGAATQGVAEVTTHAGVGGAAAFASVMASVPFPANVAMAPIVAAAVTSSIMAFAPVAAAEGGWDVPADSLALLHKKEMVLPADLAENVRNMTGGGAAGGLPAKLTIPLTIRQEMGGKVVGQQSYKLVVDLVNKAIKHREILIPQGA